MRGSARSRRKRGAEGVCYMGRLALAYGGQKKENTVGSRETNTQIAKE